MPATAPTVKAGAKHKPPTARVRPACLAVCEPNIPDRPARWGPGSYLGKLSPPTRSLRIRVTTPDEEDMGDHPGPPVCRSEA